MAIGLDFNSKPTTTNIICVLVFLPKKWEIIIPISGELHEEAV